jgi:hypothetical protein
MGGKSWAAAKQPARGGCGAGVVQVSTSYGCSLLMNVCGGAVEADRDMPPRSPQRRCMYVCMYRLVGGRDR